MAVIMMQREFVVTLKDETQLNLSLLHRIHPMSPELSRLVFKENALDKPTKPLFNNLSHYLVALIEPHMCISMTWPLFDTNAEKAYRNELSSFITTCSNKGLVTPVMAAYFVNPGCFKVTVLLFELSQLAIKYILNTKLVKDSQKKSYMDMTEKYNSQSIDFMESVHRESTIIHSNFFNYLTKRRTFECIAELFRKKITVMTALSNEAQEVINKIVDDFLLTNNIDDMYKTEIVKIKTVNEESQYFDDWLFELDIQINNLETNWDKKVSPFLNTCQTVMGNSKSLINKHTGQTEKSSYMIEYNSNDKICTKELESQVNSQQRFVLKNLEVDGKLFFPNLVRAFVISISIGMKNHEISDEVYKFNKYLERGRKTYSEYVSTLKTVLKQVLVAEAKLQGSSTIKDESDLTQNNYLEIPPLPDLSDLNTNYAQFQILDSLTPFTPAKQHFNLIEFSKYFTQPQPKLIAPSYQVPRDDFFRHLGSSHTAYNYIYNKDNSVITQNSNVSILSSIKSNETIAECSSGFTKQQILRLLSTKKSSSSKKHKFNHDKRSKNVKKGGLFGNMYDENYGLYRSYSSPNLLENKEIKSYNKFKNRKLSIMQEDTISQLELSGIACLDMASNSTSQGNVENFIKESDFAPAIDDVNDRLNNVLTNVETEMNMLEAPNISPILEVSCSAIAEQTETPKTNIQLTKKTSSLEKIISRFKKVRANVMPKDEKFISIVEEKENINALNNMSSRIVTNRVLLPDLLSPNCSTSESKNGMNYLEQLCNDMDKHDFKRPRESLGTALGVDHTFLDQFNLID